MITRLTKKYLREFCTLTLILAAVFSFWMAGQVKAGSFSSGKDTVSDSRPSVVSNHTILFTTASAWASGNTFTATYSSAVTAPTWAIGDFDVSFDGTSGTDTEVVLSGTVATAVTWRASGSGTILTFIMGDTAVWIPGASKKVQIEIGKNATSGGSGSNQFTNPPKGSVAVGTARINSVDLSYGTTATDTGKALFATLEGVTISATVAQSLSASINTVPSAACDSSFTADSAATMTNTSVSFGTITPDTFYHGCHDIVVVTNALNGYSATAQANTTLYGSLSMANTIPNFSGFGANPTLARGWGASNTYGFGFSCDDMNGAGRCLADFTASGTNSYRPFLDTAVAAQANTTFISSSTATNSTSRVDYRIIVTTTQVADTYSNIITYIITPTF